MKQKRLRLKSNFRVVMGNRHSQTAEMVLKPGGKEGGPDNKHSGSDQWLFVVSGKGLATINKRQKPLNAGILLLIERGDRHEIRNTGRTPLRTLNTYVPPAYKSNGDPLPRGK